MTFSNLFQILKKIEEGIGNQSKISIKKYDAGLQFVVFWPDGFRMSTRIDAVELERMIEDDQNIVIHHIIEVAKKEHPRLASVLS